MKHLTVIIRNDGPMMLCGDSPSYRSVRVELTEEQQQKIARRRIGTQGDKALYEAISHCFIEDEDNA